MVNTEVRTQKLSTNFVVTMFLQKYLLACSSSFQIVELIANMEHDFEPESVELHKRELKVYENINMMEIS